MANPVKSYIELAAPVSMGLTSGVGHSMDYYREAGSLAVFPKPLLLSTTRTYVNTYSANDRSTTPRLSSFRGNLMWGLDIVSLVPGATYWQCEWAISYYSGAASVKVFGGSDDGTNFALTMNGITQYAGPGVTVSWTGLHTNTSGFYSYPLTVEDIRLGITKNFVYWMPNSIYVSSPGYIQQYVGGNPSGFTIGYSGQRFYFGPGT